MGLLNFDHERDHHHSGHEREGTARPKTVDMRGGNSRSVLDPPPRVSTMQNPAPYSPPQGRRTNVGPHNNDDETG
jgi:hypothetical protein